MGAAVMAFPETCSPPLLRTLAHQPAHLGNRNRRQQAQEDEEKPDAVWTNETITLVVNQEGILQFDWDSPHQLGDVLVEACTLLPFSEVVEVAAKMLPLLFDEHWGHIEDMTSANIQITQIEFGMMRIIKNQSIDEGLMVPVWAFYGEESFVSPTTEKQSKPSKQPRRLITINAIDGTIIDRLTGY